MNSKGRQIVFPVQNPQKGIFTRGWNNFTSDKGVTELLCAYFSRFKLVGLSVPTITLTHGSETVETTQEDSSYIDMASWVSKRPFQPVYQSLIEQLHTTVFALAGYYWSNLAEPFTEETLIQYGLSHTPVWPESAVDLRKVFMALNYTRVNFNEYNPLTFSSIYLPEDFTYASFPIPESAHENVIDSAGSANDLGDVGTVKYESGQRIEARLISPKELCYTGFMAPCLNDSATILAAGSDSTVGRPIYYDDLNLKEVSFDVEIGGLFVYYKQFLVSGGTSPYRANIKEFYFNEVLLPTRPHIPWDVSGIVRCGTNTIRMVYYGAASWGLIRLIQLVPTTFLIASKPYSTKLNSKCWRPIGIKPWLISDHEKDDAIYYTAHSVIANEDSLPCFTPDADPNQIQADVTVTPPHPIVGEVTTVRFTPKKDTTSYTAYLQCTPVMLGSVIRKKVSEGTCLEMNSFECSIPIDSTIRWKVVIEFNDGTTLKCNVINYGAIWGTNSFPVLDGSVGSGVSCCDQDGGGSSYGTGGSGYDPATTCLPPSGQGDCCPVFTEDDMGFFEDCQDCQRDENEFSLRLPHVEFTEESPPNTSKNIILYVYGGIASGEYIAEFTEDGSRTGTWAHATNPSYGIIGGVKTDIIDYTRQVGEEVLYSLQLTHDDDGAANLGDYSSGDVSVIVSENII